MEIRGIGLIDVKALFGIRAVRQQKRIEVVVQLEDWDSRRRDYDRTGLDIEQTQILDVLDSRVVHRAAQPRQEHHRHLRGRRDDHLLRYSGVDSARALQRAADRAHAGKRADVREYLEEDYE